MQLCFLYMCQSALYNLFIPISKFQFILQRNPRFNYHVMIKNTVPIYMNKCNIKTKTDYVIVQHILVKRSFCKTHNVQVLYIIQCHLLCHEASSNVNVKSTVCETCTSCQDHCFSSCWDLCFDFRLYSHWFCRTLMFYLCVLFLFTYTTQQDFQIRRCSCRVTMTQPLSQVEQQLSHPADLRSSHVLWESLNIVFCLSLYVILARLMFNLLITPWYLKTSLTVCCC